MTDRIERITPLSIDRAAFGLDVLEGVTCDNETPNGPCGLPTGHEGSCDSGLAHAFDGSWLEWDCPECMTRVASKRLPPEGLREAALLVLAATDALRDARNGLGHEGEPHDRFVHMDPCTSDPSMHVYSTSTDCAACGGAEYGTEDALHKAIGDLRAAVGQPKRPWETRTHDEWKVAIAEIERIEP